MRDDIRKELTLLRQAIGLINRAIDNLEGRLEVTEPQKTSRFTPPTETDLREHIDEKGYLFSPDEFMNYYRANGWKVGKNAMKDWRATAAQWNARQLQRIGSSIVSDELDAMGRPKIQANQGRLI